MEPVGHHHLQQLRVADLPGRVAVNRLAVHREVDLAIDLGVAERGDERQFSGRRGLRFVLRLLRRRRGDRDPGHLFLHGVGCDHGCV